MPTNPATKMSIMNIFKSFMFVIVSLFVFQSSKALAEGVSLYNSYSLSNGVPYLVLKSTNGNVTFNWPVTISGSLMANSGTFTNTLTNTGTANIPTNTAPFNRVGNTFLVTGAQNTLDANRGHHLVHVWGQFTNLLTGGVDVWLTNETFHSVSIWGDLSTVGVAQTNEFNLWIEGSGGDVVTLTNKFTPGANLGVRIDGSTDIAW